MKISQPTLCAKLYTNTSYSAQRTRTGFIEDPEKAIREGTSEVTE